MMMEKFNVGDKVFVFIPPYGDNDSRQYEGTVEAIIPAFHFPMPCVIEKYWGINSKHRNFDKACMAHDVDRLVISKDNTGTYIIGPATCSRTFGVVKVDV